MPANTIRKWARHENIPSHLEKTDDGHLRVVSLDGIRRWADEIGRDLEAAETDDSADVVVDLASQDHPAPTEPPEGSMLVPLDAWNKMLNQLGNLHQAGQQLAEARERAAKAETEAVFLKERLADMRSELERLREARAEVDTGPEESTATQSAPEPASSTTLSGTAASLVKKLYDGWREKRRGR